MSNGSQGPERRVAHLKRLSQPELLAFVTEVLEGRGVIPVHRSEEERPPGSESVSRQPITETGAS